MLPDDLEVRHQRRYSQNVRTRAELIPRDADTIGVGEVDLRNLHTGSLAGQTARHGRVTVRPRDNRTTNDAPRLPCFGVLRTRDSAAPLVKRWAPLSTPECPIARGHRVPAPAPNAQERQCP